MSDLGVGAELARVSRAAERAKSCANSTKDACRRAVSVLLHGCIRLMVTATRLSEIRHQFEE